MDNLEEMDKLLEKYNLPITSTEVETVIKNLATNKSPGHMASQVNSIKYLEKS